MVSDIVQTLSVNAVHWDSRSDIVWPVAEQAEGVDAYVGSCT